MADQQIIGASIQVDTGNSGAVVKGLNKDVTSLKTSLKDAGAQSKTTGKAVEETGGSFSKLKEQISAVPGPLGEAGEGVNKLSGAFKALLANPVVLVLTAIVGVLALLYKAFTNTFEGGEKVEQIFSGIKAAGQALIDNLDKIGSAIVKVFKFDFSGAIAEIKGVADAATNAFSKMSALTKQAQELAREQATNDLDQAERAKKLAVLREQSLDETIPIAKRKEALLDLRKESQQNAVEDIDLAKRTAANKIAQLTLEKDGEKKNFVEIQKLKADQVRVETDNANELRRIDRQVTLAGRQEKAERTAAAKEAAAAEKEERQKLVEFTNKLLKLQQENDLSLINDSYQKELKALEIKIENEKRANEQAFKERKITKSERAQLDAALDIQLNLQKAAIDDKHNKEIATKEAAFQKELAAINNKKRVEGITDVRKAELVQLEIGYQEKLAQAIEHYKDDSAKLEQIKAALEEQNHAAREKLEEKFRKEDAKKAFELAEQKQKEIIAAKNFDFKGKLEAVNAEQALIQKAFNDKVISELEYNAKIVTLTDARKTIRDAERQHNDTITSAIGDSFNTLAEIAGKQTAAGKALAIASTTINTFRGAVAAFTGMTETIPGPVGIALGVVAAAGAVASGIAAVQKIVAVQVPGQSGGGSVPTGIPLPSAPVAPTQATTALNPTALNAVGNAAINSRAYVLDSDVANNRDRDERLNRAARLGG